MDGVKRMAKRFKAAATYTANNREATLRLTRPLRRDLDALTKRVRLLELREGRLLKALASRRPL